VEIQEYLMDQVLQVEEVEQELRVHQVIQEVQFQVHMDQVE
jgi:hypothetical protein